MEEALCARESSSSETGAVVAALEGRAAFYRTIASLYFKPLTQDQIDAMASADLSEYSGINRLFAEGVDDVERVLRKRNSGTRQDLAVDFTAAFAGTSSWKGMYAVPYKSVFTSEEGLLYQEGYREVFDAYKSHCVKRRDGLDFPDDHLSFMCEFLAILSDRACGHVRAGEYRLALKDLEFSERFLNRDILSWFEDFSGLAEKILKTRFYRGVLKMTGGFFELDKMVLSDMREALGEARQDGVS